MKRFLISGLSVLVAATAVTPALASKTTNDSSLINTTIQQRRLHELNVLNKSSDSLINTTLQQRRLDELNIRNKSSTSLADKTIQEYRLNALDIRNKS